MSQFPASAYQPYDSESDVVSDVESDESNSESEIDDPRYLLLRAPTSQKVAFEDSHGKWDPTTNIESLQSHVYLDPPKTTKTSLVSIKSINRDRSVYPTPYRFQLKLPRVYKNITKFQLVQLSFPNSNSQNLSQAQLITSTIVRNLLMNGVPSTCISDCISVIDCTSATNGFGLVEQGRVTDSGEPLLVSLSIPDGQYTEAQMAQEITLRANSTPPFRLITYEMFRDAFMVTRDISVLFNEPSDVFYSGVTRRRMGMHTKQDIMGVYYTQSYLDSLAEITERVVFNAYYYPILKEVVATERGEPFLQTDGIPYSTVVQRVMQFEGLDSEFYEQMAMRNRGALEVYRKHLTFEYRPVNRYLCSYSDNKCTITHDSLHLSLRRDLDRNYQQTMERELALAGTNPFLFSACKAEVMRDSAVLKHLETCLSTTLASYHLLSGFQYRGGDVYQGVESSLHVSDLVRDDQFNAMFRYTSCMGGQYGTWMGRVMTFESLLDYHSSLSGYYEAVQSTQRSVSSIQGRIQCQHHHYVSTTYRGILPQAMIEQGTYRVNQGVPVSFVTQASQTVFIPGESVNAVSYSAETCRQICCSTLRGIVGSWYSCLPTNYVTQTLQYRLGLVNILPNRFNLLSTVANITSTGNLNLFMQINDEQGFNNMDITMSENYNVTNETTGQVKLMCAKILMGAVGDSGISQTVIQNPSLFENTLGKLDRLDIKIYYDDPAITPAWLYQPYYLDLMEWNATFQIDEEIGFANRATGWGYKPTVPVPKDADSTPYLFFTHKDNPNNS